MAPRPIGTDDGPARKPGPFCVPGQGVPHGMVLPAAGRRVRDRLRDRPEIHRRLHPAVAERGDRGRGRGQPVAADPGAAHDPVGTAYAIWTGIGAVGVATVGILVFAESASPARLACLALIVAGVVGLKAVPPPGGTPSSSR